HTATRARPALPAEAARPHPARAPAPRREPGGRRRGCRVRGVGCRVPRSPAHHPLRGYTPTPYVLYPDPPSSVFLDEVGSEDQAVASAERLLEPIRGMGAHGPPCGIQRNGGGEAEIGCEMSVGFQRARASITAGG